MDFEAMRKFALALPHVTEDVKWEADLCFCIGGKMFLVGDIHDGKSVTVKVKDDEFEVLTELPGIQVAPYVGRYKWVHVSDLSVWNKSEWEHYIRQSYNLVKAKLPKKLRDNLQ
jgi:predicted DNA-binding protein (MmcQ/YjbR family)